MLLKLIPCLACVGTLLIMNGADRTPLGFPPVPVPAENPLTAAKIELGRKLFFDKRLSSDGTVSCSSCHRPEHSFSSDTAVAIGVEKKLGMRNTPSLLNVAYYPSLFWDGRSPNLEEQVRYPIVHPKEMNMKMRAVVDLLTGDSEYTRLFLNAFGEGEITFPLMTTAIAAFERTLLSGDSPFDRYFFLDESTAISESAQRGWVLFRGRLGCVRCHQFDASRPWFTDSKYHNTGIGLDAITPDLGRFSVTRDSADVGKFRTPSLRNVAVTAPYMHDGSFKTIEAVLSYYERGGFVTKFLDEKIKPLPMSDGERVDIVNFLESLTSSSLRSDGHD